MEQIMAVLEELGAIIINHKEQINHKDLEIDKLRKKIESIEAYANFYSDDYEKERETYGNYK